MTSKIIDPITLEPINAGEGLSIDRLNSFLDDLKNQPPWRYDADVEADAYDGNQLTAQEVADLEARGLPPVVVNLIHPTINMVLGMEARSRTDWLVRAEDDEQHVELAEALSSSLKKAESRSRADRACSDAYAGQIKVGMGWAEVSRPTDPFDYPYRVRSVDRREMYWDWRSREPDLSDARYLVRRRWLDADYVASIWPQHAELLRHASNLWSDFDPLETSSPLLLRGAENERAWRWHESEWRDTARNRLCVYEVWYRVVVRGHIIRLPGGRVVEYDQKNDVHMAGVAAGRFTPEAATFMRLRQSWWVGPHQLDDRPSKRRTFPYIPFWGYREDNTGVPYGMIRGMLPLQREINRRRAKMLWQLSAVRLIGDEDAIKDWPAAVAEIARPDAAVKTNPQRANKQASVRVEDHAGLSTQQYSLYVDSVERLQQSGNVYAAQLGEETPGQSGVAINSLVEQGTTTLAEINDNYRFARRLVGEALLELVVEDLIAGGQRDIAVGGRAGQPRKVVRINERVVDEATGVSTLNNDISRLKLIVELDDTPSTPTVRAQRYRDMVEMVRAVGARLPEQVQGLLVEMVIEASDFTGKDQFADRIRKALGVDPEDINALAPDEQQAFLEARRAQARQVAMAEAAAEQELRQLVADADKTEAETDKIRAETALALQGGAEQDAPHDEPELPPETADPRVTPASDPREDSEPALDEEQLRAVEEELASLPPGEGGVPDRLALQVQQP